MTPVASESAGHSIHAVEVVPPTAPIPTGPIPTGAEAIVDSHLHVKHDFESALVRNQRSFAAPEVRAHLGSQLLLYERVIIPTTDFGILPAIVEWYGLKVFEEMLECGAVSFIHRRGLLGYGGNGLGVSQFSILPAGHPATSAQFDRWWLRALFGTTEDAIALHLREATPTVRPRKRKALSRKVAAATRVAEFSADVFAQNISDETYRDVRDSPELFNQVVALAARAGGAGDGELDLRRVPGLAPNQLQIAGSAELLSAADLIVRVAETNVELLLAAQVEPADIHVSQGAERILHRKLLTTGRFPPMDGFESLLELAGVPDIRLAVTSGAINVGDLWSLRQRSLAQQFRAWMRNAQAEDVRELERMYVRTLDASWGPIIESLPARLLRFAVTAVIGAVSTGAGVVVAGVDSFFLSRFFAGYRPRLMINELRRLTTHR